MHQQVTKQPTFGEVLRIREFRAIWLASGQSVAGDQIARVSLAILVFQRTNSTGLTALVYALTYVPAIVGGALLAGVADRFPRRSVMISCDLIRAVLYGVTAIPGLPLPVMCVFIVVAVLTTSPFAAAESATIPAILTGDRYIVGAGLRATTMQLAQLAGFGFGGILVGAIGPHWGLGIDAATFAVSSLLVARFVKHRAVPPRTDEGLPYRSRMLDGARTVFGDARLRSLMLLAWLAAFYVVPEGLAPSYVAAIGGGTAAVGLLMAADPAGSAVGAGLFVRLVPAHVRAWLIGPLAFACGIPLIFCGWRPGIVVSVLLLVVTGLCSAFQIQAATTFMRLVPDHHRGQAYGLAQSGLIAVQGLGIAGFGFIGDHIGAAHAIRLSGIIGSVLAVGLAVSWERARRADRAAERESESPATAEATGLSSS